MLVASEEATLGSVIANADLIDPSKRGFNHLSFCSLVPYLSKTSMFPASGAEELKTSEVHPTPIISARGANSKFVKPYPRSPVKEKFQRPAPLAFSFNS